MHHRKTPKPLSHGLNKLNPESQSTGGDILLMDCQCCFYNFLTLNQLAMASTILRFRNKFIYQIIDQRVYRIIYPEQTLKISSYPSETNIDRQIDLYFEYLKDLHSVCDTLNIPFEESDRILFMADKRVNKGHRLNNYGSSKS